MSSYQLLKDKDINMWTASRYHDFSTGHRVYGHENKCAHAHGHNYRVHFHCAGGLDNVGRVIDFSVIKDKLCNWLEDNWDHKFILWEKDPWTVTFQEIDPEGFGNFLYRLGDENEKDMPKQLYWISTHPESKERAAVIFSLLKKNHAKKTAVLNDEEWSALQDLTK